jgi:hypothetical protein
VRMYSAVTTGVGRLVERPVRMGRENDVKGAIQNLGWVTCGKGARMDARSKLATKANQSAATTRPITCSIGGRTPRPFPSPRERAGVEIIAAVLSNAIVA